MDPATIIYRYVTPENLGMSAALWLLIEVVRRAAPGLFRRGIFRRLLPIIPETLGATFYALIPALAAEGATLGERLLVGIVVGTGSSKVHKFIAQSILGKDANIPKKAPAPTTSEPAKK